MSAHHTHNHHVHYRSGSMADGHSQDIRAIPLHHTVHPSQTPPPMPHECRTHRHVSQVPSATIHRPTDEELYVHHEGHRIINCEFLKAHFIRQGRLTEAQALFILTHATYLFSHEPNMISLHSPVTICGDIHGQYYDLMKVFEVGGPLHDNIYLFLGDYVDRGSFSMECLLYLYSLKIAHPSRIFLLRGNHESRYTSELYTFKYECFYKYSEAVYEACIRSFWSLPIAALVDNRFFCVHGGLSPHLDTLNDLAHINRFQEPRMRSILCDLLWSDPSVNYGSETVANTGPELEMVPMFLPNRTRGCSYFYTYDAVCRFLERNDLIALIRAHQEQVSGYKMYPRTPDYNFPSVISIFSAPNYLDISNNRGAVLKCANKHIAIRQFNSTPHPYSVPNFMDILSLKIRSAGNMHGVAGLSDRRQRMYSS